MSLYLKSALNNISKNPIRATISISIIAIVFAFLVLINGLMDGLDARSFKNIIDYECGHIKLHKPGYNLQQGVFLSSEFIDNPSVIIEKLKTYPEVKGVTPRILFPAMISNGEDKFPATCFGSLPSSEGVAIGYLLAERLNLYSGDYVRIITRTEDNVLKAFDERINGIIKSDDSLLDKGGVVFSLSRAAQVLEIGNSVTEINLRLRNKNLAGKVAKKIQNDFKNLNVSTWKEFGENFAKISRIKSWFKFINTAIGVIFILLIVLCTLGKQEFKTKKKEIILLFTIEGGIMGGLGSLCGIIVSIVLKLYFVYVGLNFTALFKNIEIGYPITGRFYSIWNPLESIGIFVLVVIFSLGVSWGLAKNNYDKF